MIDDIIRVDYAESTMPESMVFSGGNPEKRVPIVFSVFLIKSGSRNILVDAGCETISGFDMKNFIGPITALENLGYAPPDITDVIITHADGDHIRCLNYFTYSTVYIQRDEYARGKAFVPKNCELKLFDNEFVLSKQIKIVKIGGHTKGSCVVECIKDGKIYVLCGDECYTFYNLRNKIPTACTKCPESSRYFVNKYSDKKYICLLCHDKGEA